MNLQDSTRLKHSVVKRLLCHAPLPIQPPLFAGITYKRLGVNRGTEALVSSIRIQFTNLSSRKDITISPNKRKKVKQNNATGVLLSVI